MAIKLRKKKERNNEATTTTTRSLRVGLWVDEAAAAADAITPIIRKKKKKKVCALVAVASVANQNNNAPMLIGQTLICILYHQHQLWFGPHFLFLLLFNWMSDGYGGVKNADRGEATTTTNAYLSLPHSLVIPSLPDLSFLLVQ